MVCTSDYKVHEIKCSERNASTVAQALEQRLRYPGRRLLSLVGCIYR